MKRRRLEAPSPWAPSRRLVRLGPEPARLHLSQQDQGRPPRSGARSITVSRTPLCQWPHRTDRGHRTACVYCRRSVSPLPLPVEAVQPAVCRPCSQFALLKVIDGLTGSMFGYTAYDLRCGTTSCVFLLQEPHIPRRVADGCLSGACRRNAPARDV